MVEEPLWPPVSWVTWSSYRPDLLGYRAQDGEEELVLVECETNPGLKRLEGKNDSSVSFQSRLFGQGSVLRILAVPGGSSERWT